MDEVLLKKRALKWVKQQVSALLHGEDFPEGAQAREIAEIPYQLPAVPRKAKDSGVSTEVQDTPQVDETHGGAQRREVPM